MEKKMDNYSEVLPWLALNRLPDIGPVSQRKLLDDAGGMQQLLLAPEQCLHRHLKPELIALWRAFCAGKQDSVLWQQALRDATLALAAGAIVLTVDSQQYPLLLAQISAAPTVLYVCGDTTALHFPQLAMVAAAMLLRQVWKLRTNLQSLSRSRAWRLPAVWLWGLMAQCIAVRCKQTEKPSR
jgi:hypothetical protein